MGGGGDVLADHGGLGGDHHLIHLDGGGIEVEIDGGAQVRQDDHLGLGHALVADEGGLDPVGAGGDVGNEVKSPDVGDGPQMGVQDEDVDAGHGLFRLGVVDVTGQGAGDAGVEGSGTAQNTKKKSGDKMSLQELSHFVGLSEIKFTERTPQIHDPRFD